MKQKIIPIVILLVIIAIVIISLNKKPQISNSNRETQQQSQIEFLATETLEIERDYNQDRLIAIKNYGPGMAEIRLSATPKQSDLLAGFVGRGTTEWHETGTTVGIPEGETWQLPLLLHADRASEELYEVQLKATLPDDTATEHTIKVKVNRTKLNLTTRWENAISELDQARLTRWLIIKNEGNTAISDLAVYFEFEGEHADEKLRWGRNIAAFPLAKNQSLRLKISPRLYPTFQTLHGKIIITGINQKISIPYSAEVPAGKQVFVTLSRTTRSSSADGKRCTNRPEVNYPVSPTDGTGGNWAPSSQSGGSSGGGGTISSAPDTPISNSSDAENEEEDGEFGWIPEGYDGEDTPSETEEEKSKKEEKEVEDDDVSFEHSDDNTKGISDTYISPNSNGTSLKQNILGEIENPLDLVKVPRLNFEAKNDLKPEKEVSSYIDKNGNATHMTRRKRKDGTTFLNFGFGIQKGKRKKVPMRIPGRIGQPTMGPSPGKTGGAIAAYTRHDKEKGQVIEIIDPLTNKKSTIGNGAADSPSIIKSGNQVDLFYRENGKLKRSTIAPDLSVTPSTEKPFSQAEIGPILKTKMAPDGTPHLISTQSRGVAISTPSKRMMLEATDADIAFLNDGSPLTVIRQPDGAIATVSAVSAVSADSSTGAPKPTVIVAPSVSNSAPTLAKTKDGSVRMFFSRDLPAESDSAATGLAAGGHFSMDFKDGKWTQPRRQLLPNAEVEEAAVITSFNLPYGHAHYKPMHTKVFLNGTQVGEMKGKIPAGRYIFPVNPSALNFASHGSKKKNNITIKTKGIGSGNFHTSEHVGLYTRHKLCQDCLVAETATRAEALAHTSDNSVRHSTPDIIVSSNGYQLPKQAKPGEEIAVKLSLFNAGDLPSKTGKIRALIDNRIVGETDYRTISPFRGRIVKMKVKLPLDWQPETSLKMTIQATSQGDADPSNNALDFYILKAPTKRISERTQPLQIDPTKLAPNTVTEVIAGSKAKPTKMTLQAGTHWYKIASSSGSGKLEIEIIGNAADDIRQMHLFDSNGKQLTNAPVKGPFYLQVQNHAAEKSTNQSTIHFWWES